MKAIFLSFLFLFSFAKNNAQTSTEKCLKLKNNVFALLEESKFEASIPLLERICDSCGNYMDGKEYYDMLGYLGIAYATMDMHAKAISTGESFVATLEKNNATNHFLYAKTYCNLGYCYMQLDRLVPALECFQIGIPKFKEQFGDTSSNYIYYALQYAICFNLNSNYKKALSLNRELRNTALKKFGKDHRHYIAAITGMGNDFMRLNMYDSALICHNESLALRNQVMGTKHQEYAKGLTNLALVYEAIGNYPDAVYYLEQAKAILEQVNASNTIDYASCLLNLGSCYASLQEAEKAMPLFINYLNVIAKTKSRYSLDFVNGIHHVAGLYMNSGGEQQEKEALGFLFEARRILEAINARESMEYAITLSEVGTCYASISINKPDSAIYFINQSIQLRKKLGTENSEKFAVALSKLANAYSSAKKYDKAIFTYNQIIGLLKNLYGEGFHRFSTAYNNMGIIYHEAGNWQMSDSMLRHSTKLQMEYVLNNTEGLSETEKDNFASTIRYSNFVGYDIRNRPQKIPLKNEWLYNGSLFYKGLLLESNKGILRAIIKTGNPALITKANEYWKLKQWIGNEQVQPKDKRSTELPLIIEKASLIERELMKASQTFRNWKEQFGLRWKDVQAKLKPNEAAIEFISYNKLTSTYADSLSSYCALIIRPGIEDPILVPLFSDSSFNKLTKKKSTESIVRKLYRSSFKNNETESGPSDSLYHLIWKPLLPYLGNSNKIYFSADGVINNLNLAAIITPQGKRLIESYSFNQLGSTRNVLKPSLKPTFNDVQFWGGIDYGHAPSNSKTEAFSYLAGTLQEVNGIASFFKGTNNSFIVKTGLDASEQNFKSISGHSPEVLHIATHGFFFQEKNKKVDDDNRFASSQNPLLRSGLVLAGANNFWGNSYNKLGTEDGILTAYEIADMDLSNTKLVVLSACETGLGDIKSGEGVYGLQRAFKMAGVQNIIMSLWQVPDMETNEFMQAFYKYCIDGKTIRDAFRQTQLDMNKKYQPYQWAAFVLVE